MRAPIYPVLWDRPHRKRTSATHVSSRADCGRREPRARALVAFCGVPIPQGAEVMVDFHQGTCWKHITCRNCLSTMKVRGYATADA